MSEENLKVYYGQNFRSVPKGTPAEAVKADWHFFWDGHECRIPMLYLSDEGITMDILVFLDSSAIRAFCRKYNGVDNARMTPLQLHTAEGDRPVPDLEFVPRLVNGASVTAGPQCSITCIPFLQKNQEDTVLDAVREAYSIYCTVSDCFVCHRIHAAWPDGRRTAVKTFSLEVTEQPRSRLIEKEFTLSERTADYCNFSFRHPVTRAEHTLYVDEFTFLHRGPTARLPQLEEGWIPVMSYEILPPLEEGEEAEIMETGMPPMETDGPLSVGILDSKPGPHGTMQKAACGWLRKERGGEIPMMLVSIRPKRGSSMRYSFHM